MTGDLDRAARMPEQVLLYDVVAYRGDQRMKDRDDQIAERLRQMLPKYRATYKRAVEGRSLRACVSMLNVWNGALRRTTSQNSAQFGAKQNRAPGIENAVLERGRRDSNPQPSDRQSASHIITPVFTIGYNAFFVQKRGLQVVSK